MAMVPVSPVSPSSPRLGVAQGRGRQHRGGALAQREEAPQGAAAQLGHQQIGPRAAPALQVTHRVDVKAWKGDGRWKMEIYGISMNMKMEDGMEDGRWKMEDGMEINGNLTRISEYPM